jgi:hypothetical protein
MTVFEGKVVAGEPRPDGAETAEVAFFSADELAGLELAPWVRAVVADALAEPHRASFQTPTWRPPTQV